MTVQRVSQIVLEPDYVGEAKLRVSQVVLEVDTNLIVVPTPPYGYPSGCSEEVQIIPPSAFIEAPATTWQTDPRYTFWTETPGHNSWFQNAPPGVLASINGFRLGGDGTVPANQHWSITLGPADFPLLVPGRRVQVRGIIVWSFYSSAIASETVRLRVVANGVPLTTIPSGFPPSDPDPLPFAFDTFADVDGNVTFEYGIYGDTAVGSLSLQGSLIELELVCLAQPPALYGYIMKHHA